MVGVPKRARGCEACKKRRISCDQGQPRCHGCKTKNRACRYPNAFTFVVNDPGTHRTVYRKINPDHSVTLANDGVAAERTSTPNTIVEQPDVSTAQQMTRQAPFAFGPVLSLPQHISSIGAMQQQLLSYALCHFSLQPSTDIALVQTWIPTLQQFATSSTLLKASPLACCAAWIARTDFNPSMTDFSRHLYAEGLHEVRTVLKAPGAILDDETLGACLALAAFEVFECPAESRAAYQWHRRASVNLVHMRGAKRHQVGLGHELFLAVRLQGIFHAFEQRRPNYLCTREWSTVPWEFTPKDDLHRLADILAKGPQLLQEAEDLPNKPLEQSLPTLLTILSRLLDIDAELESYYSDLQAGNTSLLFWDAPNSGHFAQEDIEPSVESNFEFVDHRTASILTLYWSIAVMVWSALEGIHNGLLQTHTLQLLPEGPRTVRFLDLAPKRHWLHLVHNIIRGIDYCMSLATGSAGPPGIGVALEIIIDIMRQNPGCDDEYRRAVKARDEMGKRWAAILLS